MMASAGKQRGVLIVVENLPVPFDRRVWQEARTLQQSGYVVSVICPKGKGCEAGHEVLEDIHIYRYGLPIEADSALGYAIEYSLALFWQLVLAWRVFFARGFDVIHACNPPDDIFVVGLLFKFLGKKFLFDHHDLNPEMYEAKFGKRGFFYRLMLWLERWTYAVADLSIATNESYREIAIKRCGMAPEKVFVVRSGPDLERLRLMPSDPEWKNGRQFLVGYVGVMGKQDGIDILLRVVSVMVLERQRRDTQFVLVGGGTELPAMRKLAESLEVSEFVTFTGRAPDEILLSALSSADVCVNPDPYTPHNDMSTMNKVVEYMALGKPIVQFDLMEGRVSAEDASLYAVRDDVRDFTDRIIHLLDHPEERARMGKYARERVVMKLQWKHEAPKLLAAYEALFRGVV